MAKTHPDEKLLQKFAVGKLNRRDNLKVSWHLFNCATCRQQVEQWAPQGEGLLGSLFEGLEPLGVTDNNPSYERALTFTHSTLEVRGEARDRDRRRAPKLYIELARHPVSRRRSLLERTWRFKNYVFGEYLIEESARRLEAEPSMAEDLAELGLVVANQLAGSHYGPALINDLRARAWAAMGTARRVGGDAKSGDEAFAEAERFLAEGTGDVLLRAQLLSLKGDAKREQRSYAEAAELLNEALRIFREAGEERQAEKAQASRQRISDESGQPELLEQAS